MKKYTYNLGQSRTISGILLISSVLVSGCTQDIPTYCEDPDFRCYIDQSIKNLSIVKEMIWYWSTVNLIAQILIVFFSILSTLMIALQGDSNKYWTRPIGIIATTLVTGISSALVTFHIPENVDKVISAASKMVDIDNDFDYKLEKLKQGKTQAEINEAYRNDAAFREAVNQLTKDFSDSQNKIRMDLLRIKGTSSQLNTKPPSNAPNEQSNQVK